MELLRIRGGRRLEGHVAISGSKNASLPVDGGGTPHRPGGRAGQTSPISRTSPRWASMLEHVGVKARASRYQHVALHAAELRTPRSTHLSRRMRGPSCCWARWWRERGGEHRQAGGDDIGMRRVEQHLEGLR